MGFTLACFSGEMHACGAVTNMPQFCTGVSQIINVMLSKCSEKSPLPYHVSLGCGEILLLRKAFSWLSGRKIQEAPTTRGNSLCHCLTGCSTWNGYRCKRVAIALKKNTAEATRIVPLRYPSEKACQSISHQVDGTDTQIRLSMREMSAACCACSPELGLIKTFSKGKTEKK